MKFRITSLASTFLIVLFFFNSAVAAEKVIVVGAGISGLAAAKKLKEAGFEVVVLEARDRIGGRIWTDRSTGTNVDLGASWIHGVTGNPIKTLADEVGTPLSGTFDYESTSIFDSDGTEDPFEDSLIDNFEENYDQYAEPYIEAENNDKSVQDVIDEAKAAGAFNGLSDRAIDSIVNTSYEHEQTGEANKQSVFGPAEGEAQVGGDVMFLEGYDAITNHLATGLDIRLQAVVSNIKYDDNGVTVTTGGSSYQGDRVVVTVPLGVLKAGSIGFDPALPDTKQTAIDRLGYGVLNKVWLGFPSVFWDNTSIHNFFSEPKGRFNEFANWHAVSGQKYLLGFNAAVYGEEIEAKTDEEIVAEAMQILRTMWGEDIPAPTSQVITRWNSDPYAKGAYSYIAVGSMVKDRETLAESVNDRLFFAGEATDTDYAATTNGAYTSGIREADKIIAIGELDPDGDGVKNLSDDFPNDATAQTDTDDDGIANQVDADDDGDGIPDTTEEADGTDPLDALDPLGTVSKQFLMTTSASANITSLHIVNEHSSAQTFKGTLYNGDGDQLGEAGVELTQTGIEPNARLVLKAADLETLFDVEPWKGPAMLEVSGSGPYALMSKLVSPSGLTSNTNCVRETQVLNIEGADSENRTFVRFINTTNEPITDITGTLYDANGDVIGDKDVTLLESLDGKEAVWINRSNFAELVDETWEGIAMLEIEPKDGLKLLNLNLINSETFFNFSCFEKSDADHAASLFLQTTSSSLNISYSHLVNTSDEEQSLTGTLYNGKGEQLGDADQPLFDGELKPNARAVLSSKDLETIFGADAWRGPALLEIKGSARYDLMTKLTSPSGLVSNTNCVRQNSVHNIEGADSQDMTFVRFINVGVMPLTNIKGTLYNSNGEMIGSADQVLVSSLAAKAAVWVNRDGLADIFGETWNGEATLKITSPPDSLRLLNLNFINSETFFNFSCYEGVQ